MMTLTSGCWSRILRVTSSPSIPGSRMSTRKMSGSPASDPASSSASSPSVASPTTTMPPADSSSWTRPSRARGWSSATPTLITLSVGICLTPLGVSRRDRFLTQGPPRLSLPCGIRVRGWPPPSVGGGGMPRPTGSNAIRLSVRAVGPWDYRAVADPGEVATPVREARWDEAVPQRPLAPRWRARARRRLGRLPELPADEGNRLAPLALVAVAVGFNLYVLRAEILPVLYLNDSSVHLSMVRWALQRMQEG